MKIVREPSRTTTVNQAGIQGFDRCCSQNFTVGRQFFIFPLVSMFHHEV